MKTCIIYKSYHHFNTLKILNAMKEEHNIDLIDITKVNIEELDITDYQIIGFASGVYYNHLDKDIISLLDILNIERKQIFFVYTCGLNYRNFTKELVGSVNQNHATYLGSFGCRGYDTYKIFGKLGGLSKKHPNQKDFNNAKAFINKIIR